MHNKLILESLAMDLKRVAIGNYRKSFAMVNVFMSEAIKRKQEIDFRSVAPYIEAILNDIENLKNVTPEESAEKALMYSTLLQNYSQNFYS